MGFKNREIGKYFTFFNGKVTIRATEDTEGAKSRVNKLGKTVFELSHDSFEGILTDIRTKESAEYGKTWEFVMKDVDTDDVYILQCSYSNSYATAFLKMLPNIDVTKPFTLTPSQKVVDGKTQSSLFINQGGATIKHAYTKEVPNGLPPMTQIMVKGKETWDDTDRLAFLANMVNTEILPKLGSNQIEVTKEKTFDEKVDEMMAPEEDLGF